MIIAQEFYTKYMKTYGNSRDFYKGTARCRMCSIYCV